MGVDINVCKLDHICCFKCHDKKIEQKIHEIELKQTELENRNRDLENENKIMKNREKDVKEKEKELNQKEEKINNKIFDLIEKGIEREREREREEKERERGKEVFRTDMVTLNCENDKVKTTINASRDYNYKGEVLNQRIEKTYIKKENPNNYLDYSNNYQGNLLPQYPNYSNSNNNGNGFNPIEFLILY